MTKFLLDTNVFVQAKNFHYQFGFCTAFWELIAKLHDDGMLYSIIKVKKEILRGNDELVTWVNSLPESFWLDDTNSIPTYPNVINWASSLGFKEKALKEFSEYEEADAWLVSYAHQFKFSIISQEKSDPAQRRKIYLADAALAFNIKYLTIYEFLSIHSNNNFSKKN